MPYKYEIDDNLILRVWDLENPTITGAPGLLQPFNPESKEEDSSWKSKEEAETWILNEIEIWEGRKERPAKI